MAGQPELAPPTGVQRVLAELEAAACRVELVTLPKRAPTAEAAAAALAVDVGQIANSLVFRSEQTPILVMASGAHRVDTQKVADVLEFPSLQRAEPSFVKRVTSQAIGGVAPVGHPQRLRTVVDVALAGYDRVWVAAGVAETVLSISYSELLRVTAGIPAEVA